MQPTVTEAAAGPQHDPFAALAAELERRLPADEVAGATDLLRRAYASTPAEELAELGVEAVVGPIVALWKLGQERQPGRGVNIRVYNPQQGRDGWSSPHTAIDVVNDDMPFLLASTKTELQRQQRGIHMVLHPVLGVERDADGRLQRLLPRGEGLGESWMHFEIDRETTGEAGLAALAARLGEVLAKVRVVVEDWRPMVEKAKEIEAELRREPPPAVPADEVEEAAEFLRWLTDNHFTFLGYRRYRLDRAPDGSHLRLDAGPGLGIHRQLSPGEERSGARLPDYLDSWLRQRELLIINKASTKSEVHRPVHIDSIGIRRFDEAGDVVGEDRFSGIFTTRVYSTSAASIPLLRRKLRRVVERANFNPGSHDAKGLVHVIESFPRDELFQISEDDLFRIGIGILQLQQRQRVALFIRRDELERFISALVFVPRDRYSSELREKLGKILAEELGGPVVAVYTTVGDAALARVQYILVTKPGEVPAADVRQVEAKLAIAARTWREELRDQLVGAYGEEEGLRLLGAWAEAFPAAYRDRFGAADALADVGVAETLRGGGEDFAARLYRTPEMPPERLRVKLYLAGRQVALTDALPLLENLGVRVEEELPFEVRVQEREPGAGADGRSVWIHDFALVGKGEAVDFETAKPLLEETLRRVWRHELENGVLNRLVLAAGLHWRQVAMLRAYSRYLRQIGMTFSQTYIANTMVQHREVSQLLVQLFCTLFDPAGQEDSRSRAAAVLAEVRAKLETVASLDEDRILRGFLTVIKETLRTNFFQTGADGHHKPYLSFKLDSRSIRQLPDPKPRFEIFVYSPRMEGVHLRGGLVARGGIRWSDRREDFRTEVLGLLKAQMVKNAVIVPVGAKGGFVVKKPPTQGGREAQQAEGIACYKTLVRGMLDLTDNILDGEVVHPPDVVRRDGDDSYLVVAADKGTATFSDVANGLSAEYRHWLGDAFASGGSAGYDHKKMGITARGAWEAVKRHFREMGRDIQSEPFTCVGVGDMSGDVFGNGMLLSRHTRLIAAFDHRHVFVDPDPNEEKSFEERQWLFEQPRSSWADYDRAALSPGGDVFERAAKQVSLSDEAAAALGLGSKKKLTPNELVQAILVANVDLLWLGGIGTFVKATRERHGEVGDRANDATRVDAPQLRCKVVGEGANLGFTQRARIEYALHGGRINTDAIDNSAGVDTSDHEVNIKIALNEAVRAGKLDGEGRNDLLRQMTDEVAALVLRDNYLQTQAISLTESMAPELLDRHAQMIRAFEKSGRLDRKIEFLPDEEEIRQRAAQKRGLVRPELAVLLAYAKIALYEDLLASDVPDDPLLGGDLLRYFPQPMVAGYRDEIERHRLRREIIATYITNSTINRVGPSFVFRMMESTGRSAQEVARAYAITRDAFELRNVWAALEALDNKVPAELQLRMLQEVRQLTEHATLWFLQRHDGALDVSEVVATFGPPLRELARELEGLLPAGARRDLKKRARDSVRQGVPEKLAQQVAALRGLLAGNDVVRLALAMEAPTAAVARVYFGVGERLGVEWLRAAAATIKVETEWQRAAIEGLLDDLSLHQVAITWQVLAEAGRKAEWREALQAWEARHPAEVARLDKLLAELRAQEAVDLAMLAVADRQLQLLASR